MGREEGKGKGQKRSEGLEKEVIGRGKGKGQYKFSALMLLAWRI